MIYLHCAPIEQEPLRLESFCLLVFSESAPFSQFVSICNEVNVGKVLLTFGKNMENQKLVTLLPVAPSVTFYLESLVEFSLAVFLTCILKIFRAFYKQIFWRCLRHYIWHDFWHMF